MFACIAENTGVRELICATVIADNAPDRSARQEVAKLSKILPFPVIYLETEPYNKSAALNAAIQAAPTRWLAFTDDDTLPDLAWLSQADQYRRKNTVRVFGGRILPGPIPNGLPPSLRWQEEGDVVPEGGVFVHYAPLSASGILEPEAPAPLGSNVFVHASVFDDIGGYDERLWNICGKAALGVDDGEFGVRLHERAEPVGYCREALVRHPVHTEKTGLWHRMRHVYYYGWRDPIVFFDSARPLVQGHVLKLMFVRLCRAGVLWAKRRPVEAANSLMWSAGALGAFLCRFSAAYRERQAYYKEGS
jgi:GT2 family glycosyltransferase